MGHAATSDSAEASFLRALIDDARRSLALDRVTLFGSRARVDARGDSDYDIAIEHHSSEADWCAFVNRIQEDAATLADLDIVDLREVPDTLKARIRQEGVVLYG